MDHPGMSVPDDDASKGDEGAPLPQRKLTSFGSVARFNRKKSSGSEDSSPSPSPASKARRLSCSLSTRRFSTGSPKKKKAGAAVAEFKEAFDIDLVDTDPRIVTVVVDTSGQHTLSWTSAIDESPENNLDAMDDGLPEDSKCNLYLFPTIMTPREPRGERPSMAGIRLLRRIFIYLAENTNALTVPDEVGAFAIHALVVCNTPESLELSMELFERVPALLAQVHVKHRAGFPLFSGESSLHICAVNKREKEFIKIVQLAMSKLEPEVAREMITSHTEGVFFTAKPMQLYGSSALAYACIFEQRQSIVELLKTGFVSFNSRQDACKMTGFMPLHCIVANGLLAMYEYVTAELPHELRADESHVTKIGTVMQAGGLSSLQLAAKMSDHRIFRHILKRQCAILWVWGPVTQFSLNLRGIDSAGAGGGDIMELITRMDASKGTTEMLLDTFMNGFIYRLFQKKWKLYGRKLHYMRRSLDLVMLVMLIMFSVALKNDAGRKTFHYVLAVGILVVTVIIIEEEVRTAYLFSANEQGEGDARISFRGLLKLALQFCKLHWVHVQLVGLLFASSAALMILIAPDDVLALPTVLPWSLSDASSSGSSGSGSWDEVDWNATTQVGRRLTARSGGGAGTTAANLPIYDEGTWAWMWLLLTIAQFLLFVHFFFVMSLPLEKLHILLLSIINMLKHDVLTWLVAYICTLFMYFMTMYTLYPRSGMNAFPMADKFNSIFSGAQAVVELGFVSEPVPLRIEPMLDYEFMSASMWTCSFVWVLLYITFIIMTMILLLNLLIAMLTYTFDSVLGESILKSRLSFSRCIIKMELVAESFGVQTRVGIRKGPEDYVFEFRSIERNVEDDEGSEDGYEGDFDEGGADPFQDPAADKMKRIQKSVEALNHLIINQQKMLIATAKGDTSWINDPDIVGSLAEIDDAPAIEAKPPSELPDKIPEGENEG